ncbi:uncharacterized protein VTP21DRAFT_2361 [Calcarisporiella thermophila]|uniref:uncharacterized protein n=1 Tax=Calcarisporiella thermophila TaxID=911321 RepID=UPI003744A5D2
MLSRLNALSLSSLRDISRRTITMSTASRIASGERSFSSGATSAGMRPPKLRDSALMRHNVAFINNEWVKAISGETFAVTDPSTGDEIGRVPEMTVQDLRNAIAAADSAFEAWAGESAKRRHDVLKQWFDLMQQNADDLATILTWENGKPLREAKGEIGYGASFIEWFAEEAVRTYGDVIPSPNKSQRFVVVKQPVGVVGVITPWNFPNAMITRKVGAALAAGCPVVVKPAAETPFSALAMAELAARAGIPPGVFNVVTTHKHVQEFGEALAASPVVKKISFTGSTRVGKILMRQSADTLKKLSMELGGNAPFIVFDDADLDAAVDGAIASKFRGSGQTCVCANRIYVQSGIYADFASRLAERVSQFIPGDGFDERATHGPLIHRAAVEKVQRHVEDAVKHGAEVLVGGGRIGDTNFFEPTVLSGMRGEMAVTREETFGPVAGLYRFEKEEEVVSLANDSSVGLAGYFYTRDLGRAWRVAERLQVGMVGVNTGLVSSVYAPFGGVKESGFGREGSKYGIAEYLHTKYICMGL